MGFFETFYTWIENILEDLGLRGDLLVAGRTLTLVVLVVLIAVLADFISRKILVRIITRIIERSKSVRDDIFLKRKVFNRLAHIVPALIIWLTTGFVFAAYPELAKLVMVATKIYIIVVVLLVVDGFVDSLHEIYHTLEISKNKPIKGYVQVVKILLYFVAVILVLSALLGKAPTKLLTGLGALAAVLILVFKDTILGLVASVQLSANKMVKPGDWVEMPKYKADGTVLEISLNTVKVQNWDKTISTIPTYALVSESFTNWRGMEESGGRRIKRSVNIDMNSIRFCDQEMIEKFRKIRFLNKYIDEKLAEIEKYNKENGIDDSVMVNGRRITNFGTFRRYIEEYLRHHPKIHKEMTFLVRHLQPTEKGIPLEIYVFSNDQAWARYEAIQADIFDHILAVIPEFGLQVFQNPSGSDFQKILS